MLTNTIPAPPTSLWCDCLTACADIEAAANNADRSMNSVFVQAVRQYLDGQNRQTLLLEALASAVPPIQPVVSSDRCAAATENWASA